ncbi:uncharacterized protein K452DRAFT_127448 [Aplosporella prunicola CBS 121167]|uniref:Secreted protein n=1 Tax=Aplosporella prunicola CBS 121167 TaxID=1176127 RepID=A0A6A6AXL6_9PEZI|nr:uncharacterized protein K452DRAFT_127448 [Aplosporella prunicola CBS 121167]KAF2136702.1 hypothetical protein K452DRAFT_127448 [Aplosporella prunicola CBS 121167]
MFLLSSFLLLVGPALCAGENTNSFQSPANEYRAKFRYWLPDASVPNEVVARDIAAMAKVGAGGFEFLPYYQYGLPEAINGVEPPTDWTKYGFGTDAFRQTFRAALEAAEANGVLMDFSQGANQGQGTPAVPGTEGLAVELDYVNVTLAGGDTFDGALPLSKQPPVQVTSFMHALEEFGEQTLLSVVAAEVVNQSTTLTSSDSYGATIDLITVGDIVDLTDSVGANNSLTWTAPAGGTSWRVFAFYERYTNQRSVSPGLNATDYIQNGSWTVDHFSAAGGKKLTDFFDEHVIPDEETRELLAKVGKYAWEDSLEMETSLWWTPGFQDKFEQNRGYSIRECLPLLMQPSNYWVQSMMPWTETFVSANSTFTENCNEDYRITLNEGYQEYLGHYQQWAHGLGIEYSAQPAYNLPLNALDDIPLLDGPEGESLGFDNIIDTYRQFSGPIHLTGKKVLSSECGAVGGAPYLQTVPDLLWSVNRGLATGISMHVLHGYAYSGEYANTTWPSYTTFTYRFSEMWGLHQPVWRHMRDAMEYIARNQWVSQSGTPKVDLVFYQYSAPWIVEARYQNTNLETLGYTYDYLGPGNLQRPEAVVKENVLAPNGPAYKALIFSNQTSLTSGAVSRIHEFASAGLPIFFVGATNFTSIGQGSGEAASVSASMSAILDSGLENVYKVASADDLPTALTTAGILPRLSFSTGTKSWYSFWRRNETIDYAFLYNDGNETHTSTVSFAAPEHSIPYVFDAWTGAVSPVLQYATGPSTNINIKITLAPNQTTILGFASPDSALPAPAPRMHVTAATGGLAALRLAANGSVVAVLTGPASLTLSDGRTVDLAPSDTPLLPPTNLSVWDVAVHSWDATADMFSMATAITRHNFSAVPLRPWNQLDPGLGNASGTATYTTTFGTPNTTTSSSASLSAFLTLTPHLTNTARASLNGIPLPPLDPANPRTRIPDEALLPRGGLNRLTVEVATTLFNVVRAQAMEDKVWTAGVGAEDENGGIYSGREALGEGLLGSVRVMWEGEGEVVVGW